MTLGTQQDFDPSGFVAQPQPLAGTWHQSVLAGTTKPAGTPRVPQAE